MAGASQESHQLLASFAPVRQGWRKVIIMTTGELVLWALTAQTVRENSWSKALGKYRLTIDEACKQITPNNATVLDLQLCTMLNHVCWNEVQYWAELTQSR